MSAALRAGRADVDRDKRSLRDRVRRLRAAISPEAAARAAEAAAAHAAALDALARPKLVALYAALPGEISTAPLAAILTGRGAALAFPRVVAGQRRLRFHLAAPSELAPGAFGILEPTHAAPEVELGEIEAFVVPGVAFDRAGGRLGWGRGHYDTTLHAAPGAIRVGYCFSDQLTERVPTGERDEPMDWIVTELGALRCPRGAAPR